MSLDPSDFTVQIEPAVPEALVQVDRVVDANVLGVDVPRTIIVNATNVGPVDLLGPVEIDVATPMALVQVDPATDIGRITVEPPELLIVYAANTGPQGPPGPQQQIVPFQTGHTYAIADKIYPDAQWPGFAIPIAADTTVKLARLIYRIASGTSVTFSVQRNGSPVTGLTNLVATTAPTVTAANVVLADLDFIQLVLVGVAGEAANFSATIITETALT